MNELFNVTTNGDKLTLSARELHKELNIAGRVLDVLIKNGCRNEDLKEVSNLLSIIYAYGFEVGKRCVKE